MAPHDSDYLARLHKVSDADGFDLRVTWRDWLRVLSKRRWVAIGVFLSCFSAALFGSLLMPPKYSASTTIQLDRNTVRVVEQGNVTPTETSDREFFQTQYQLLQSRALAERVVSRLDLATNEAFLGHSSSFLSKIVTSLSGKGSGESAVSVTVARRMAVGIVMANTSVEPVKNSRLVTVRYVASTPNLAQSIANALAEGFVSSNLDRRIEATTYAKTYLEDQLQEMKLKLEESDRVLLDFAQKEQIVSVGERSSLTETNMATANASLGSAINQRIQAEQLWRQAESASGLGLPQFLNSTVIQGLRAKRSDLSSEYKDKLSFFKPGYPDIVKIKSKMDEIDRLINAEVALVKGSLHSAYQAARNQEEQIATQLDVLKAESLELQRKAIQYNILKREAETNRSIYDGLLHRYKEVAVAGGVGANNISIVDRAEMPGAPSSPRVLLNVGIGGLLGLICGVGAALLREYIDDTLKSGEELERVTGLPVLGVVPKAADAAAFLSNLSDPRSSVSEAYRSLVTSLQFSTSMGMPKTLLVTSARPREGKSTTALALARNLAAIGQNVALVDCDLRKPTLHGTLGIDNSVGLTNYLAGGTQVANIFIRTDVPNLSLLPSGPLPPNPAELLSGARLQTFLSIASEHFDVVILDGPPIIGLADSPILGNAVAGTLLIVAAGETRAVALTATVRRLHFVRSAVVGVVLSKFDSRNVGYGYDGYGYGDYEYYSYGDSKAEKLPGGGAPAPALPSQNEG
jgi:capsular exopolysaccharide synthesis family protein